ncbi:RING finger protein 122 isoform X2 [Pelodiscus sinensis]|uniref:RING finger protein 122 isoform X2 n=1 Tax=Pelodiscus sinensis TaxID=13735 RepID=UPI003F6B04AF
MNCIHHQMVLLLSAKCAGKPGTEKVDSSLFVWIQPSTATAMLGVWSQPINRCPFKPPSQRKCGRVWSRLELQTAPQSSGCFCGLGLIYTNKSCTMPPITFQDLPLNIYMVIFGTGIFVFVLSLIFCCYFISKLRHQAQSERFGYKEVVLKGDARKLNLHGVRTTNLRSDFYPELWEQVSWDFLPPLSPISFCLCSLEYKGRPVPSAWKTSK